MKEVISHICSFMVSVANFVSSIASELVCKPVVWEHSIILIVQSLFLTTPGFQMGHISNFKSQHGSVHMLFRTTLLIALQSLSIISGVFDVLSKRIASVHVSGTC